MRSYRITADGKTYHIEIDDPNASPVRVQVDGKPFEVYVERQGGDAEATVTRGIRRVRSRELPPVSPARIPKRAPLSHIREDEAAEIDTLTAPMPGTILSIAVRQGDRVQQGQEICVLEAMKMKNSIKSPREGIIAEVAVSVGAMVAYGDPLVHFQ